MSEALLKKCGRGRTWFGATETISATDTYRVADQFKGTVAIFPNKATATSESTRNSRPVHGLFVRNVSGIALLPGRTCVWKTGKRGLEVVGYGHREPAAALSNPFITEIAGIVDDWLPAAGVRANDYFWLITKGEVVGRTSATAGDIDDDAAGIIEGDVLFSVTAAASTFGTTAGRLRKFNTAGTWTAANATEGTATWFAINRIGRAISAKTSGATDQDILIDVDIRI